MLTRSKTRDKQSTINKTMNNKEEMQNIRDEDSCDSCEVYNQLGLPGVIDEEIRQINLEAERREERPEAEAEKEVRQISPEATETRGRGLSTDMPDGGLEGIFRMLQEMQRSAEEQNQKIQEKIEANSELQNKKIEEKLEAQTKELKGELQSMREENLKMHQETKEELRKTETQLRAEMKQMRDELKAETRVVKEDGEKTRMKMEENKEVIQSLKGEISKNRQQIAATTSNLSENLNRINNELRSEIRLSKEDTTRVKKSQEEIEEQVKKLEEERKRRIDEIKERQDQITRRMNEVEGRPFNRGTTTEIHKDVNFNGRDCYPMEFLRELKEIKQLYYPDEDIKWIVRFLSEDALTWWRIAKCSMQTFEEFEQQFVNKFWSANIQERVRDRLEYDKFRPDKKLTAIQYVQKQVLLCRQLQPPLTDAHIIKKLARHFSREIEIAVLLRSIRDITQFEDLLHDFERIRGHDRQRFSQPPMKREQVSNEPTNLKNKATYNKEKYIPKGVNIQRNVETMESQPSGSGMSKNGPSRPGAQ